MKISIASLFVSLALASGAHAAQAPHKGYLIKLKKPVTSRSLSALSHLGVQVTNTIPEINIVVANTTPQLNDKLTAQADLVEYVVPNYYRKAFASKDIYEKEMGSLWGMRSINAAPAWRLSTGDPSIVVAVSDTGVYHGHMDLQKNIWTNAGETGLDANGKDKSKNKIDDDGNGFVDDHSGWNFETNNNNPIDDHYHGTHVAGTIGARGGDKQGVAGVAWNVKIMNVKFIGKSGYGTDEGGIGTIIYAANNGAKVVNCSWGGDEPNQAMYDAIEYAKSKGTLVVAAAGNDNWNLEVKKQYPAAYTNDNLITVAAITGGKNMPLATFSNYGVTTTHLAAPGDRIYSAFNPMYQTLYCESKWFCTLSGTSMAAPHVAGAVGLIYSVNPKLTYKEVKEILMGTVTKADTLKGKVASGGTLNLAAAVARAKALVR
ncbi:MAG TPA: S8 family peptidase [Bdellovibrionales bacterium]|nr:S8 family peptidase [Bdellovibrionales bacterium]